VPAAGTLYRGVVTRQRGSFDGSARGFPFLSLNSRGSMGIFVASPRLGPLVLCLGVTVNHGLSAIGNLDVLVLDHDSLFAAGPDPCRVRNAS
jgi:hypothetical protein